jgi:hypothetical protein
MLDDLDSTLTQLLNDAPAGELPELAVANVSFEPPDHNFTPAQPTVDLFLHDVREDRELRDPTPVVERDGERFTRRPAPLRANCAYTVTAWGAGSPGPATVAVEHRLLGQAVTWLSRFPTIPAQYLQGFLSAADLIYPPPVTVARVDPNQNAGEFWNAMGVTPRPAFALTVTVELGLGAGMGGDLVLATITESATDRPWIALGGRVVTQAGGPVPDAVVDIVELSLRTRSLGEGRFSFPRVPPGQHTLRVHARGFHPHTRPLEVPGRAEDRVVALTPN